jgi:hypothetical protein
MKNWDESSVSSSAAEAMEDKSVQFSAKPETKARGCAELACADGHWFFDESFPRNRSEYAIVRDPFQNGG